MDKKDAKGLSTGALKLERDTSVGQPLVPVAVGNLPTQSSPDGAVGVFDLVTKFRFSLFRQSVFSVLKNACINGLILQLIVALPSVVPGGQRIDIGHGEEWSQIDRGRFRMIFGNEGFKKFRVADNLIQLTNPERGENLAHIFRDGIKEIHHRFGSTPELGPEFVVLGGHPRWTVV